MEALAVVVAAFVVPLLVAAVGRTRGLTLIVTIGTPGCGKTTAINGWLAADRDRRARLARDGLRVAIGYGGDRESNTRATERAVSIAQYTAVAAWLLFGLQVGVDDTCQAQRQIRIWWWIALLTGARLVVWDFRGVPLEVCVAHDAARGAAGGRLVGEPAITEVAGRCAAVRIPSGVTIVDMAASTAATQ